MSLDVLKISEAVEKAVKSSKRNFTQSIDVVVNLRDIDMKKPESKFSEFIELPKPIDKEVKICVIGSGQFAMEAKKAGADRVIEREELETLGKNSKEAKELVQQFDYFIADASMMPIIGKTLGSLLGPRGKMPRPIPSNAPVGQIMGRQRMSIPLRLRDQPVIQCRVGSEKMDAKDISENVQAVIRRLEGKLERGFKNISSVAIKTTMGKPVQIYKAGVK